MAQPIAQLVSRGLDHWIKAPEWPPPAFSKVTALFVAQTWLDRPDPDLRPGKV